MSLKVTKTVWSVTFVVVCNSNQCVSYSVVMVVLFKRVVMTHFIVCFRIKIGVVVVVM